LILFDSYQARWIREKSWGESEEKKEKSDGSLLLKLHVAISDELKRWIMGYGSHAIVLSPSALRQEILKELEKTIQAYRSKHGGKMKTTSRRIARRSVKRGTHRTA
jgi:predicted DNA-binding transcriptional regulator YafY